MRELNQLQKVQGNSRLRLSNAIRSHPVFIDPRGHAVEIRIRFPKMLLKEGEGL